MKPAMSQDVVDTARRYAEFMLLRPSTPLQWLVAVGVLVLVLAFVLPKIEGSNGAGRATSENGWIMAVLGPLLLLGAAAALKIYALPSIQGSLLQLAALVGGVVLAFLLLVVPISKFLFRSEYVSSLIAWLITIFCAAITVFVVHLGTVAFGVGTKTTGTIEEHNEIIRENR